MNKNKSEQIFMKAERARLQMMAMPPALRVMGGVFGLFEVV